MLTIRRYPVKGRQLDEVQLIGLSINWIDRVPVPEPDLVFIIPCTLITASFADEVEFRQQVQKELGEWHRWLNSLFSNAGDKRRWMRTLKPQETYTALCAGLLIRRGVSCRFEDYLKTELTGSKSEPFSIASGDSLKTFSSVIDRRRRSLKIQCL